ncbi:unnamed protein product [Paramecium primaurelia]|uniref:RING-type domain-containing protein n=1 Tax=Paramecium primaurelia TaxID=5886 RepID=A0A8S1L969_PARPR|nr:unnamed protein product [Paramecium primaurelia]
MKKQRSRKSFSLNDSIDEDRRKEEIIQKLLESSTNLQPKKLATIKFDLEENEMPVAQQIQTENTQSKNQIFIEYLTPSVVKNNLDMVKENLHIVIEEKMEDSKCLNWSQLIIEFIKVIAFFNVLLQQTCSGYLSMWFYLMFVHDIIEIGITIKIVNVVSAKYESRLSKKRPTVIKRESKYPMAGRHSYYGQLLKEIEKWENTVSIQNDPQPTRVIQYVKLHQYNEFFYLLLILWGLLLLGTQCQSDIIITTFHGFILLGIITLSLKLIYYLSFKFCISAVVMNYLMFADKNQQNNEIIANIPKQMKKNYDFEICYLCSQQIKQMTSFVDLPCNKMHRFHEKCILKWLQTHLFCPVCVEPIDLMNVQMRVLA